MRMAHRKTITFLVTLFALFVITVAPVSAYWFPMWSDPGGTQVIVYIGQTGASTYETSLNGVLFTQQQIGTMADRILWTEGEIGTMADRIVYVTEISQNNSSQIIYQVTNASWQMSDSMWNAYYVTLQQVSSLPAGW